MKIHFTCSTAEFDKYKEVYFKIREFLVSEGHLLTRDWLPHTSKNLENGKTQFLEVKDVYKANMHALDSAELVIVEDTVSNFSTGHQITLALQKKKPTLVLWQGKKHRKFNQMFIHGIESNILKVTEYQIDDLEDTIREFIGKFEHIRDTNRFHLVLSGVERKYLDWAQFQKEKSRTQIIKDAINEYIDKDQEYKEYLRSS